MIGKISPVKIYPNFYSDRDKIRKDHKGKKYSGIYLFINLEGANYLKMYVGQSKNILGRMNNYLNHSYLKDRKNKQPFPKALLKHGTDNFTLIIIEYVARDLLNVREIFWIALLHPYYNILKGGKKKRKRIFS
jgi:group I intron endonuclease